MATRSGGDSFKRVLDERLRDFAAAIHAAHDQDIRSRTEGLPWGSGGPREKVAGPSSNVTVSPARRTQSHESLRNGPREEVAGPSSIVPGAPTRGTGNTLTTESSKMGQTRSVPKGMRLSAAAAERAGAAEKPQLIDDDDDERAVHGGTSPGNNLMSDTLSAASGRKSTDSFDTASVARSTYWGEDVPHDVGLLPMWTEAEMSDKKGSSNFVCRSQMSESRFHESQGSSKLDEMTRAGTIQMSSGARGIWTPSRFIMSPSSCQRIAWDLLSMYMVLYDVITLPLQLFDPPATSFDFYMAWVTRLFWTADIPMNFMTGFLRGDGFLEMRSRKIILMYLKTWCVLDVLIVLVDWLELIWGVSTGQTYMRMGKASRAIRLARLIRLLRVSRIFSVATQLAENMQSDRATIAIDLSKYFLVVLGWSHFTACLWYGIGAWGRELDFPNWIDDTQIHARSLIYSYLTSAFTGGMDEVKPLNAEERAYCIATYIAGFVLSAAFASVLTSSMTRLHLLANEQSQQLSLLRRYLHQNKISRKLCVLLRRNASKAMHMQHIAESHVALLQTVSRPLQVELRHEMHSPILCTHGFFFTNGAQYPHAMREACHTCTSVDFFSWGDIVFHTGERDPECRIFFVRQGHLEYNHMSGHISDIMDSDFVSEASLWLDWTHCGSLANRDDHTSLLEFSALKFQDVVRKYEHHDLCPWAYAKMFLEKAKAFNDDLSDVMGISPDLILDELTCLIKSNSKASGWPFLGFA